MKAIIRKQQQRLVEDNKQTAFRVRKRPVTQGKINRYIAEHRTDLTTANYNSNISGDGGPG